MSLLLRLQSICTNSIGFTNIFYSSQKHPSVDNEVKGRHERRLTALLFCRPEHRFSKVTTLEGATRARTHQSNRVPALFTPSHHFVYFFAILALFFFFFLPSLHDQLPHYAFTLDCSNVYILPSRHLTDHILTSCFPAFQL